MSKYDISNQKFLSGPTKLVVDQKVDNFTTTLLSLSKSDMTYVNTCRDNSYVKNVILDNNNCWKLFWLKYKRGVNWISKLFETI